METIIERKEHKVSDLYFTAKNKKGLQGRKLSLQAYIICYKSINFVEIVYYPQFIAVYHQTAGKIHAKA